MTDTKINDILEQRGKTYGDFSDNAKIAQGMKEIIHSVSGWDKLHPYQQEALDMILSKISRIVTGDPEYVDSWDDIAGYATLVSKTMSGVGHGAQVNVWRDIQEKTYVD